MAYRIRKRFTFEAAHQLETAFTAACHECIHGHSYTVEVFIDSEGLDKDSMVIDFGFLKEWINQVMALWDHGLILHENKRKWIAPLISSGVLKESKVSFLPDNPTAETMARILYANLQAFLLREKAGKLGRWPRRLRVSAVKVHETSTGWAEYIA